MSVGTYLVGREKVREFARAVGETDPLFLDPDLARHRGYADVVAPPMFAVVYCLTPLLSALADPDLGIESERLVHSGQEFVWGTVVIAGDEITTRMSLGRTYRHRDLRFVEVKSVSCNQHGAMTCLGTWTNIELELDYQQKGDRQ